MITYYAIGLGFISALCLVFSVLGFLGKEIILDGSYTNAPKEEQEKMDKDAYRLQGAVIFLFIFAVTLCNLLQILLHVAWLSYVAWVITVGGIVYFVYSHNKLKQK